MKKLIALFLFVSGIGLNASHAFATGLVTLPAAGLAVAAGVNQPAGTTAYVRCNQTGNYGSDVYSVPTSTLNNRCAVFPSSINTSPVSGFTLLPLTSTTSIITANNETLGQLTQRVFRNAGNNECIYAKRITMSTTGTFDYNPQLTGSQGLEVNDVALGGFSGTADVSAGYYSTTISDSPVYRMGRAFTSVQMQANSAGTSPAAGYVHQPLINPAPPSGTEINGVGQTLSPAGSPSAAQQAAEIRTNWVDFTVFMYPGNSVSDSSMLYVRSVCNSAAPATTANTVRIRQTGRETQPWVTILTSGQTVSGANANF